MALIGTTYNQLDEAKRQSDTNWRYIKKTFTTHVYVHKHYVNWVNWERKKIKMV